MRRWVPVLAVGALLAVAAVRACRDAPAPPTAEARPVPALAEIPPPPPVEEKPSLPPPERTKLPRSFVLPTPPLKPPPAGVAASVWGRVTMDGPRPSRKRIRPQADPRCAALHPEGMLSDDLVLGPENQVRWALLHVTQGLGGRRFEAPKTPARLDQVACRYVPHVLGLQVDQPLEIANLDPLLHNVHGLPFDNKEFNFGQPQEGVDILRSFPRPEIFKVKCDVHPWMSAWIGVFDHPYFAVTDEEGVYRLAELPPGRYGIRVWHEGLVPETLEVDVGDVDVRRDFLLQRR